MAVHIVIYRIWVPKTIEEGFLIIADFQLEI